ncbi:hypothetical protein [Sphingobacterium multivorum]|uniref:hypothetical protein n=1 Tax=Sphingobacterium multivorum TaxID=28454 RepID=UPI00345F0AE8
MNRELVTIIISILAVAGTLISSTIGHYFTAKARSSSFRQQLYSKQLDLITELVYKQSRFKLFLIIILDMGEFAERALGDMNKCLSEYSELTHKSAVILPTDLYIQVRKINNWMSTFAELSQNLDNLSLEMLDKFKSLDVKMVLTARSLLGIDELSDDSTKLFATKKDYNRIKDLDFENYFSKNINC